MLLSLLSLLFAVVLPMSVQPSPAVLHSDASPKYAVVSRQFGTTITDLSSLSGFEAYQSFDVYSGTTFTFTLDKTYYLSSVTADIDSDDNTFSVTSLTFARFTDYNASTYKLSINYSLFGFSSYMPLANELHIVSRQVMGWNRVAVSNANLGWVSDTFNYVQSNRSYIDSQYATMNSGPYNIVVNRVNLYNTLSNMLSIYIRSNSDIYWDGYKDASESAYDEGYDDGKRVGFDEGVVHGGEWTPVNAMSGLFSVILSVPIDILNGFNGFIIWNTPVTALLISFAVMGILLWVIKRFIK